MKREQIQDNTVAFSNGPLPYAFHLQGAKSFLLSGSRPLLNTPILHSVYKKLVSYSLCAVMESEGCFPRHHLYAHRKGLGTCDAMLDIVYAGQATLDRGR